MNMERGAENTGRTTMDLMFLPFGEFLTWLITVLF